MFDQVQLDRIERKQDRIIGMLQKLLQEETFLMTIQDDLAALQSQVAANTNVVGSAETAMAGLKSTVDALSAQIAAGSPVTSAQLQALSATLTNDDSGLAAAITANTPAAAPAQ